MAIAAALQGLFLGLGRSTGAAAFNLEGELQVPALLLDPCFSADQEGLITDFRVGGQTLMCSDQGVGWKLWHAQSALEGSRAIGLPVPANTKVSVSGTLVAAGTIVAGIGVDPIPPGEARVPNSPEVADRLNYVFGLGSVAVPAGGDAFLAATCKRECTLGPLVLWSPTAAAAFDVTVENVEINNKPMPAGRVSGANIDRGPLTYFDFLRTDLDGRTLNAECGYNHSVAVKLHNFNGGPITVYGGILVLPE